MEMLRTHSKRVLISSKIQITIPQKYYVDLGFDREAICTVEDGKLVLIPVDNVSDGEFSEQILEELIAEGFSGESLLKEFKKRRSEVRPAVEKMLKQAKDVAVDKADYVTYKDIFDVEETE